MHIGRQPDQRIETDGLAVAIEADPAGVVVVVRVFGELDLTSTAKLDRALQTAFGAGRCRTLVLDLSGVSVMDSTGLRALWTIRHEMREIGGRLVLRSPSDYVLRLLVAAGLTSQFEIEYALHGSRPPGSP